MKRLLKTLEQTLQRLRRGCRSVLEARAVLNLDELPVLASEAALGPSEGFTELIPGAMSVPSRRDFALPAVLSRAEKRLSRLTAHPVRPLGYYTLCDVVCAGEGYILKGDRVCCSPSITTAEWRRIIRRQPWVIPYADRLPVRTLSRPAILFISREYRNYGHLWLDIAPRLYLLWRYRPEWLKQYAVIVPADLPSWSREILTTLFGLDASMFETYDPERESLRCPSAIVPTLMHTDPYFHPAAAEFYRHVVAVCAGQALREGSAGGRLFLTRRRQTRARVLANIDEVEALAVSMGFAVIAPEELSWREQVALFSKAEIVAGEHGSAMKNLLFSSREAIGVTLNYLNPNQAMIAAFKGQRSLFLSADGFSPRDHNRPFTMDIGKLKLCLQHVLQEAARMGAAEGKPA